MLKRLLILILAPLICNSLFAQVDNTSNPSVINHQIWIDFYPHYYVNEKLEYYGDTGFRTIVGVRSWSRLYARPSIKYHFNKNWEAHAGLGIFYIFNADQFDQFEITPWQGVQWNWNRLKRIKFNHLVKLEERWSFLIDNSIYNFEFRFRYKLSGKIFLTDKLSIPFYGEIFLPLTGKIQEIYQNQGRAGVGLGYKASKDWHLSFLFNWQRSKDGINGDIGISDYVYQVKIKKVWKNLIHK